MSRSNDAQVVITFSASNERGKDITPMPVRKLSSKELVRMVASIRAAVHKAYPEVTLLNIGVEITK